MEFTSTNNITFCNMHGVRAYSMIYIIKFIINYMAVRRIYISFHLMSQRRILYLCSSHRSCFSFVSSNGRFLFAFSFFSSLTMLCCFAAYCLELDICTKSMDGYKSNNCLLFVLELQRKKVNRMVVLAYFIRLLQSPFFH